MPPESFWLRVRSWDIWVRSAVVVWCAILLVLCIRGAVQPRSRNLYPTWATAGSAWLQGANLYPAEIPPDHEVFRYGPPVAALFAPAHWIPERLGNVLWRLLNAGVL